VGESDQTHGRDSDGYENVDGDMEQLLEGSWDGRMEKRWVLQEVQRGDDGDMHGSMDADIPSEAVVVEPLDMVATLVVAALVEPLLAATAEAEAEAETVLL
jgi:hypothetical protein